MKIQSYFNLYSLLFVVILLMPTFGDAQDSDKRWQLEFNGLIGTTPANEIILAENDYSNTHVTSEKMPAYALQFRIVKPFSKRLYGVLGASMGVYGRYTRLEVSEDFLSLVGDIPYHFAKNTKRYDTYWGALTAGVRVPIINYKRTKLLLHLGANFNYQKTDSGHGNSYINLDNGSQFRYYETVFGGIPENRFILSPDLGLIIQQYFNDKLGINLGVNSIYSNKPFVQGIFIIYGDNDQITGSYFKKFIINSMVLGVTWRLD